MPGTKRTTKVVSYHEQEDDDDFIQLNDVHKKSRPSKSKDAVTDLKPPKTIIESPEPKCIVKLSKIAQEEPTLVLKPPEQSSGTEPIVSDDQEITNSPLEASSIGANRKDDHSILSEDQDENSSPEFKRAKHNEEDDENSIDDREEPTEKTAYTTTDLLKKRSSLPFGFPTSKINISSPHTSRVGLSRKSATIKPLHPSFTSRSVPE